jgi:hypothetical protein
MSNQRDQLALLCAGLGGAAVLYGAYRLIGIIAAIWLG